MVFVGPVVMLWTDPMIAVTADVVVAGEHLVVADLATLVAVEAVGRSPIAGKSVLR